MKIVLMKILVNSNKWKLVKNDNESEENEKVVNRNDRRR